METNRFDSIEPSIWIPNIGANAKWTQNGVTVAGGNGWGNELNQLARPLCLYVDDDQTVYVSDHFNHRIVRWRSGDINAHILAGGNGQGNRNDQLDGPLTVIRDKKNDCIIISDYYNKRVVRWPCENGTSGEVLISNVACSGMTMDSDGYIYIVDHTKHEVRRWKIGDVSGTLVAGGNGDGDRIDQLRFPRYIFIDQEHSLYITDYDNNRIVKWMKDAKMGIIVAGTGAYGNYLNLLSCPHGIIVDQLERVYIADNHNHRVVRWSRGATQGIVVVGGNKEGSETNQLDSPCDLAFDKQNNLYVLDYSNQRVQKFHIQYN